MEILFTVAYIFLIWTIHFKFKFLRFNLWIAVFYCALYGLAILADIVLLGQVTPYSSEAAVDSIVIQLQPKWSGYIDKIFVEANSPIKKDAPIIRMQTNQWKARLKRNESQLPKALKLYKEAIQLVPNGAMANQELILRKADVDKLRSDIDLAKYNLEHTITYAPCDGYIPIMYFKPGMFISLLTRNAIPFVCTDKLWLIAKLKQQSVQYVKKGDPVEIAFDMYPGVIINGRVHDMVWAIGDIQFKPSSDLPTTESFKPSDQFFAKIEILNDKKHPIHYGASAKAVIYTDKSIDLANVIRRIEIRCESLLNFIYDPFH